MFLLSANHVALYAESDVVDKVGCHRIPGHKFRIRMIGPFLFHIPILSLFHRQNFFSLYSTARRLLEIFGRKKKKPQERKTGKSTDTVKYTVNRMATQNYKNQLKGQNGTAFKKYWNGRGEKSENTIRIFCRKERLQGFYYHTHNGNWAFRNKNFEL